MKEIKVISFKCFPRKPPINLTLLVAANCKAFAAPEWVWGAAGLLVLLFWMAYFSKVATEKEMKVNPFTDEIQINGEVPTGFKAHEKWESRLREAIKNQRIQK